VVTASSPFSFFGPLLTRICMGAEVSPEYKKEKKEKEKVDLEAWWW
jgi:hypothetical protein